MSDSTEEERNKAIVREAFETLFNQHDYDRAEKFWADEYLQHSAHIPPGRDGLFALVKSLDGIRHEMELIMADGDMVMVSGRFSTGQSTPGSIVIDKIRMEDGRLKEHWDVQETEATEAESLSGLPMFGDRFPDEA